MQNFSLFLDNFLSNSCIKTLPAAKMENARASKGAGAKKVSFASPSTPAPTRTPGRTRPGTVCKDIPDYRGRLGDAEKIAYKMAAPIPVMDSGLIAVALIIRSRDGPRFVYHYPARPTMEASRREVLYGTDLDESKEESS